MGEGKALVHTLRIGWRWKQWVNCDPKSTVNHVCYYPLQYRTLSCLNARVSIDLDELDFEVLVEHKIIPEYLKGMVPFVGIYLETSCPEGIGNYPFYL